VEATPVIAPLLDPDELLVRVIVCGQGDVSALRLAGAQTEIKERIAQDKAPRVFLEAPELSLINTVVVEVQYGRSAARGCQDPVAVVDLGLQNVEVALLLAGMGVAHL